MLPSGTTKCLPHRLHRTFLPRTVSGTWRMLRHFKLGQISVMAMGVLHSVREKVPAFLDHYRIDGVRG